MKPTLEEQLREILDKAERLGDLTEEETRARVIDPILKALGWPDERRRMGYPTHGGGFADLALLSSGGRPLVFVEAKELAARLDDKHVRQALGYAQAQGARWAVLTNGYEWRVYDAHHPGPDPDRLVLQTDLRQVRDDGTGLAPALHPLSPEGIESGELEAAAEAGRAYEAVRKFLSDEQRVARTLQAKREGFHRGLARALDFVCKLLPERMECLPGEPVKPQPALQGKGRSLPVRGRYRITLPDGSQVAVEKAKDILVTVAEYFVRTGKLTAALCPIAVAQGQRYLINTEPRHQHRGFFAPTPLSNGLYLETHSGTEETIDYSRRLAEKLGLSRDSIKVEEIG